MRDLRFRAWHKKSEQMLYSSPADIFRWEHEGEPIEVMQFTGLHDKNGKEIYEGDIVQFQYANFRELRKGEVKYGICEFWIVGWEGELGHREVEVIGNIYENPELLINN